MQSTVCKYLDFHYVVLKIIYLGDAKCSEGSYIHLLLSTDSDNLGVFASHLVYWCVGSTPVSENIRFSVSNKSLL